LSATANEKYLLKKYSRLEKLEKKVPFVVSSEIIKLKTKELLKSLKNILGKELFELAIRKKTVRSGKGKLRGRKYKSNAGMLFVVGNSEKLKTNAFEVKNTNELGVTNLAEGGLGRLTVYTEEAIKELENKFKEKNKK
jgi:large subunit ribosomal protein L4e